MSAPPRQVSASPPAEIRGPNAFQKFTARVTSVKPVEIAIGTSDVTAESRKFLELGIEMTKSEMWAEAEAPLSLTAKQPSPVPAPSAKPIVTTIVHVAPREKVAVGDTIEGVTRNLVQISRGWTCGTHLSAYKILKAKTSDPK